MLCPSESIPVVAPGLRVLLPLALAAGTAAPAAGQAGTLDPSFGTGGLVRTDTQGSGYEQASGSALYAQRNDGRIVVAGFGINTNQGNYQDADRWIVARFLEDGTPDPGFGTDGWVSTDVFEYSPSYYSGDPPVGVATDGNATILVGNRAGSAGQREVVIVRYLDDGSLDPGFGTDGVLAYDNGLRPHAFGVAVEANRILVGMTTYESNTPSHKVVAFQSNGALSQSYGNGGVADFAPGTSMGMQRMLGREEGGVVLQGTTYDYQTGLYKTAVVALDASGELDTSFSGDGILTLASLEYWTLSMKARPGGGLALLQRQRNSYDGRVQLISSGGATSGNFPVTALDYRYDFAVLSDGSVVTAGYGSSGGFAAARYSAAGQLDTSFGTQGVAIHDLGSSYAYSRFATALPGDGILLIGQRRSTETASDLAVAKLLPGGGLDSSFGGGSGYATVDVQTSLLERAQDLVALQGDGKLLVLGISRGFTQADTGTLLARYEPDGTLDPTFGQDGIRVLTYEEVGHYINPAGLALQSSGRVLIAGYGQGPSASGTDLIVVALEPDGTLDPTFGATGLASVDLYDRAQYASGIAVLPDDRILVGGYTQEPAGWTRDVVVARLTADGQLDTSYANGAGLVTVGTAGVDEICRGISLAPDGRAVTVAHVSSGIELGLIEPDGGTVHRVWTSVINTPTGVAVDALGRVIVGGREGTAGLTAARFLSDGTLDYSFDGDGVATLALGTYSATSAVAVQGDHKVVVSGLARISPETGYDFAVARLNEDGTPDAGFGLNGAASADFGDGPTGNSSYQYDVPYALAIQGDGGIVLAGATWLYDYYSNGYQWYDIALARFYGVATPDALIGNLVPVVQVYAEIGLLNNGESNALQKKLEAALQLEEGGNAGAAIHQVEAFENQVLAMIVSGQLPPSDGQALLDWADDILTALGA